MPEVVISRDWCGLSLSDEALEELAKLGVGAKEAESLPRDDARLVAVARNFGEWTVKHGGRVAVVEVPAGRKWTVFEYDGAEAVLLDLPDEVTIIDQRGQRVNIALTNVQPNLQLTESLFKNESGR